MSAWWWAGLIYCWGGDRTWMMEVCSSATTPTNDNKTNKTLQTWTFKWPQSFQLSSSCCTCKRKTCIDKNLCEKHIKCPFLKLKYICMGKDFDWGQFHAGKCKDSREWVTSKCGWGFFAKIQFFEGLQQSTALKRPAQKKTRRCDHGGKYGCRTCRHLCTNLNDVRWCPWWRPSHFNDVKVGWNATLPFRLRSLRKTSDMCPI